MKSGGGFYGDVTGRAGVTVGNALLYAKGGFAFFTGNVHITDSTDNISQDSGVFTGWTFGGGLEYKLSRTLTMKAEYLYFDLDNSNFSCCIAASPGKLDDNITANTMKVRFELLFERPALTTRLARRERSAGIQERHRCPLPLPLWPPGFLYFR